jgi:hypothetical protein
VHGADDGFVAGVDNVEGLAFGAFDEFVVDEAEEEIGLVIYGTVGAVRGNLQACGLLIFACGGRLELDR